MKLGIHLDLRTPARSDQDPSRTYAFALELCEEAERVGLDSIWTSEHHMFSDGYLPQPLTFAAAVAARTRRVRVGTAVLLAPFRSAVHLAEEAAVVDLVSGGRLDLGLGAGYRPAEFELYEADITTRYATTDARVGELRQIWAEGVVTPAPSQSKVPIWLGYNGPKGARRAGRMGECLLSADPELLEPYRLGLSEGGHSPESARMAGTVRLFVTDDPQRDWPRVAPHHRYVWQSYREASGNGGDQPSPHAFDAEPERTSSLSRSLSGILVDTPEVVARQVARAVGPAPVETVIVWASPGALPEDLAVQHVRTLGEQLAPLLAAL